MANEEKKYASLNTLFQFLENIKANYAQIYHTHNYAQINHTHGKEDIPYLNDIENNIA